MSKMLTIDSCVDCPQAKSNGIEPICSIKLLNNVLLKDLSIPRWCPLPDKVDGMPNDSIPLSIPPTGPVTERDILAIIAENDKPKREYKYATFEDWWDNTIFAASQMGKAQARAAFEATRELKE